MATIAQLVRKTELQVKLLTKVRDHLTTLSDDDEKIGELNTKIQEMQSEKLEEDPSLEEDEEFSAASEVLENECPSLFYELGQMATEVDELLTRYKTYLSRLQEISV